MNVSPDLISKWVESRNDDGGSTLSSLYLGEELSGLNADQIVRVVNALWHDFCGGQSEPAQDFSEEELAQRFGEWTFVRGGMTKAEIAMDGNEARVERFCGGWTLDSDDTAAMLEGLYEAAPADKRP